jgi:hypothetical protein
MTLIEAEAEEARLAEREEDRAFVRFDVVLLAVTMGNFDRQLRLEGVTPEPETRRRAIETLIREYADGNVVLLHKGATNKKAPVENTYLEAHRG